MRLDEQSLHVLAAWREAPFYSERERAAFAWCEALTLLPQTGAPDESPVGRYISTHRHPVAPTS